MPASILLIDDDPLLVQMMGAMLAGLGRVRFATSGIAALQQLEHELPDVILLDAEMPGMSGFDVCGTIRASAAFQHLPVIFVTAHRDQAFEVRCFEAGAVDFIQKPVNPAVLRARVGTQLRLKQALDTIEQMALTDALTGLDNRRAFDKLLSREWKQASKHGSSLGMLLVDVDCFKQYNDTYGRPAGDACLANLANAMQEALLRPHDTIARYGGEEFAVLLPDVSEEHVLAAATRLSQAVLSLRIPHRDGAVDGIVSVSVGGAVHMAPGPDREVRDDSGASMIRRAHSALYQAKQQGRARICMDAEAACGPGS